MERYDTQDQFHAWYEHWHRYHWVAPLVAGKYLVDLACGEGYGSAVLAQTASQVTGVDISAEAITHASVRYHQDNLQFKQADVLNLDFPDHGFDVVVSFETLEHLVEHDELMASFKRVMKPGGILIISTPDKAEYSDKTGFENEYHLKELYQTEFSDLVSRYYRQSQWFGQKLMFTSTIWQLEQPPVSCQFDCMTSNNQTIDTPPFVPMYYVVVASDNELPGEKLKDLYTFTEQDETVYGHYNAVIRAHIEYENKYNELSKKHQSWLDHPIIGRCIKWFSKD